jgi:hypothetical protein
MMPGHEPVPTRYLPEELGDKDAAGPGMEFFF